MTEWNELNTPPPPTGYYEIGGTTGLQIHLANRPSKFHQWMMFWGFGWRWVDINPGVRANGDIYKLAFLTMVVSFVFFVLLWKVL